MKAKNLVREDRGFRHAARGGTILFRRRQQHACLLKVANRAPRLPPARARTWLRESRRRYRLPAVFLDLPVLFIDSSIHMKLLTPLDQFRYSEADRAVHHAVTGNLLSLHASIHHRGATAAHQERIADKPAVICAVLVPFSSGPEAYEVPFLKIIYSVKKEKAGRFEE